MNIREMHKEEGITSSQAVLLSLVQSGFTLDEAKALVAVVIEEAKPKKKRSGYIRWTDEQKEILRTMYESGAKRADIVARLGDGFTIDNVSSMVSNMRLVRPKESQ